MNASLTSQAPARWRTSVLRELGYRCDLERVDLREGRTAAGVDYSTVNPKGYVPALVLDDGEVLTEVAGDPPIPRRCQAGAWARNALRGSIPLPFAGVAELHLHGGPQDLGGLFNPNLPAECREVPLALFDRRCDWLASTLGEGPFLTGERYTIGDPYLLTVLNWTSVLAVDLDRWPALKDYLARIAARPAGAEETLKAEGLTG